MNILIYGIGGVGGYFGGKLAKTNHNVTFIARGAHLEAIKRNGLEVKSVNGNFTAIPDLATDDLTEITTPDLVILGVKSWQVSASAKALQPYLRPETVILPLQNGADNIEKLLKIVPKNQILGGLCRIISYVKEPGVIEHPAFEPIVIFGEIDNSKSERVLEIKKVFDEAGFTNKIADDIEAEIWKKFLFICTISGLGGLTRVPIGKIRESEYLYKVMQDTANEILAVAKARGINISETDVENTFKGINNQNPETTASTQRDITDGKPSELENFNG
ncbi:MAG: 2-dehydropantoate 2-reductase, partial [Leeuwenhoekiella sp.]